MSKSIITLKLLLLFWLAHYGEPCLGQDGDRYNYRDQCRSLVAGKYWQLVDDFNSAEIFVRLNRNNLAKLESERDEVLIRLRKLRESKKVTIFDPERDELIRVFEGRVNFIKKNIETIRQKIPELEKKSAQLKNRRLGLKARMIKVFDILEKPADSIGTVPKSITYKTICPKYRHVCPLPPSERQALKAIFVEETIPTPCLKYSYIR